VADYSEFPTTPTRWYENLMPEPETSPSPERPSPPVRHGVDAVSLVMGLLFAALAVLLMAGVDVDVDWFGHGISWVLLIGAGIALLVNELRKSRRRHR
jgi:hypothetical protein